jgi:D-alanyl-D-alanine carboxypeptidase
MNLYSDTLSHPVVKTAHDALKKRDITPILKWVKKEKGKEIQGLFEKTLIVRNKGKEAQEIADKYFLETFVKLHLAGEGRIYIGKTPAGVVEHAVPEEDKDLETVSVDVLVNFITRKVKEGIHERFDKVKEAKKHADHSIEAGREYKEAYIQFTHYAEWGTMMLQCIQDIVTART